MKDDSLWFKDAVVYELHVRSFADASGDGIGDFQGLREKLPYLEALGVTALWLLPFYPSPLRDDGYDIADYYTVNSDYGTLADFQEFLDEAHRRGLRVITELVINHTSEQHPWFQLARRAAPGSPERDFYVWSDTPRRYEEARIIFKDFESSNWAWDPVAQAYYWHRFYSHQPDLNFDNPAVRAAVFEVLDFWLGLGVDGLRLDAVPYLFERDGTSCENLPETHAFLREMRRHVDEKFPGRMLLAEANQWPEDAVAYFGQGDECHMEFHFPLMPRLFMSLQMEDRFPLIDILDQTPTIPENCQWAIFLRNHDELTLEMVTDEERDYMVRIYAEDARARINLGIRRRLAPLLGNNRRKIELINALLLSLPGTPILYYGDEVGMGDNFYLGDRHGVRTPMQWSADRNAGFSRANPQQLFLPVIIDPEFHYEAVNVDVQEKNLSSLLWWTRRILAIRQQHPAFARGSMEFLPSDNAKVLTFLRQFEDETILVVANLSRFSQGVLLDLSRFAGWQLEESFGNTLLPAIGSTASLFTIGPNGFYWMSLRAPTGSPTSAISETPVLPMKPEWTPDLLRHLERKILPAYLRQCRWFGGKQQAFRDVRVIEAFNPGQEFPSRILLIEVTFAEGPNAAHILPLAIGPADAGEPGANAAVAHFPDGSVLWDALYLPSERARVLELIEGGGTWTSGTARLVGVRRDSALGSSSSRLLGGEQSNSSIVYDDKGILKFLRRYEDGPHPDADILRALAGAGFSNVPTYLGEIRCVRGRREGVAALLTSFVPNQGDGWTFALDSLGRYFERVLAVPADADPATVAPEVLGGNFPERMRQLGERTGELHRALESLQQPDFAPEPFTGLYRRSLYQSLRGLAKRTEIELRRRLASLDESVRVEAEDYLSQAARVEEFYRQLPARRIPASKIRIHGDYHLGQVLNTGRDFIILDFEGEPRRSLGERLLKRPALVDVAGMIRSFDYAVQAAAESQRREDRPRLEPWLAVWRDHVTRAFLDGYLTAAGSGGFVPADPADFDFLLRLFLLDKAIYEVGYEMSYRPAFLPIPLRAVRRLMDEASPAAPQPEAGSSS
ncbi:MAG: maltose alpha-D-glucosyltransferase [Terrimicrobiaceae bacterium]|nr:maltose alpha-D-glucosyltransferase [Terrimicrobiaceae bacterium]